MKGGKCGSCKHCKFGVCKHTKSTHNGTKVAATHGCKHHVRKMKKATKGTGKKSSKK